MDADNVHVPYSNLSDDPIESADGQNNEQKNVYSAHVQNTEQPETPVYQPQQQQQHYGQDPRVVAAQQQQQQYGQDRRVVVEHPHMIAITNDQVTSTRKRGRATWKHVLILAISWLLLHICLPFTLLTNIPFALTAYVLSLVSLWKQERGQEKTSNKLAFIAMVFIGLASVVSIIIAIIVAIEEIKMSS